MAFNGSNWYSGGQPNNTYSQPQPKVTAPPRSQIPGLGVPSETPTAQESRKQWIKDTDSDYIKLSKQGGRSDLLNPGSDDPVLDRSSDYPAPTSKPEWLNDDDTPPRSTNFTSDPNDLYSRYLDEGGIDQQYINSRPSQQYADSRPVSGQRYLDSMSGQQYSDSRSDQPYADSRSGQQYADSRSGQQYADSRSGQQYADSRSGQQYADSRSGQRYQDEPGENYMERYSQQQEPITNGRRFYGSSHPPSEKPYAADYKQEPMQTESAYAFSKKSESSISPFGKKFPSTPSLTNNGQKGTSPSGERNMYSQFTGNHDGSGENSRLPEQDFTGNRIRSNKPPQSDMSKLMSFGYLNEKDSKKKKVPTATLR